MEGLLKFENYFMDFTGESEQCKGKRSFKKEEKKRIYLIKISERQILRKTEVRSTLALLQKRLQMN